MVAEQLNLPWRMIAACPSRAGSLYDSAMRRELADFAWAGTSSPPYVELEALAHLKKSRTHA